MWRLIFIICAAILASVVGCSHVISDWQNVSLDSPPWIGPGKTITWQERVSLHPFVADSPLHEFRMLNEMGRSMGDQFAFAVEAGFALRATPMWNDWPLYDSNSNYRNPPYEFTAVSLDPLVVLVWNRGTADARLLRETIAANVTQPNSYMRDPQIPGLVQQLYFTAAFPPVEEVRWFSPDLTNMKSGFQEIQRIDDLHAKIVLPTGELLLEKTSRAWRVTRR